MKYNATMETKARPHLSPLRDWVNADDGNRGFCPVCQGEICDPDETTHKRVFLNPYASIRVDLLYAKMDFKAGISGFTLEAQTSKYENYHPYRFEQGDIPPFWYPPNGESSCWNPDNYVDQPKDTRSLDDYLEIKCDIMRKKL
jgi:hypothetical protein